METAMSTPWEANPATVAGIDQLKRQAAELALHVTSLTRAAERVPDGQTKAHLEYLIRQKGQRLADLTCTIAVSERTAASPHFAGNDSAPDSTTRPSGDGMAGDTAERDASSAAGGAVRETGPVFEATRGGPVFGPPNTGPVYVAPPGVADEHLASDAAGPTGPANRTDRLVRRGRRNARARGRSRRRTAAMAAAGALTLGAILGGALSGGGASWPSSVATVQREITVACRNPNVAAEPDQVDFACGPGTRRILWIFALLTSGDQPNFVDRTTGRRGLEPISPVQGGELAWALNLHHPYNPDDPIDSLEVAARAINNIIAGATVTDAAGKTVVEPGLEADPADCARYTGSAAVTSRAGFPPLCSKPVTSPAGQAALVSDVFQKWEVGASAATAREAAVLFENAEDPSDPQVQAILAHLTHRRLGG